jgi:hypothetical protein
MTRSVIVLIVCLDTSARVRLFRGELVTLRG